MLTAKLEMCIGSNNMIIPYKIDTGSDGNIIPWYIFKKLFPRVSESQLTKTIKDHIKLKKYNKTFIAQLGTCAVIIAHKNNRRKCEFFVVLGNGQVLLGMPDTAALNIINVNMDSIEAEDTQRENCNTNIGNAKTSNAKQKTHGTGEYCTNTDDGVKNTTNDNGLAGNTNPKTLTNYFPSSSNLEIDKRKSALLTQKICSVFDNVFNGIRCFESTFSL